MDLKQRILHESSVRFPTRRAKTVSGICVSLKNPQRGLIVHDSTEFGVGEQESCLFGGVSTTIYILYVETSFHSLFQQWVVLDIVVGEQIFRSQISDIASHLTHT